MVKLYDGGVYLVNGAEIVPESESEKVKALTGKEANKAEAKKGTMAYNIIKAHNRSDDMEQLRLKFDSMTSHDITYVGIIQTARASGMTEFPLPYVLTNCHNSLCAVGGTFEIMFRSTVQGPLMGAMSFDRGGPISVPWQS